MRREQPPDLARPLDDRVVAGEEPRHDVAEREQREPERRAQGDRPRDHPSRGGARARRVAGAEHAPDHDLRRDRQRVEHEREEDEQLERDLVRAEARGPDPREHRGGDEEGAEQRRRAHGYLRPDPHQRAHPRHHGPLPAGAQLHHEERQAHAQLSDHGAPRGARQPPAEAVDEQQLEHDVDRVRDDEDLQRRGQVADPAQVSLAGAREHERRARRARRCAGRSWHRRPPLPRRPSARRAGAQAPRAPPAAPRRRSGRATAPARRAARPPAPDRRRAGAPPARSCRT